MADEIQNIKICIVGEADFSQLDQSLNKLTAEEKQLADQLKAVDSAAKASNKSIQQEAQESTKAVNQTNKSFDALRDNIKGLASQIPGAFQVQQVLEFGKAAKGAAGAVGGMSSAMNVLKIAIASTGIGLLIVAIAALVAYFAKSEAGGDKLAKIMNVLKVVFGQVMKVLIDLGEIIVDVLSVAFDGFVKLVGYIEDYVFESLTELAELLDAIGFEEAADAVNEFNDSLKKSTNEIRLHTAAMIKLGEEIADLEDKLGGLTIDMALANSKLTTEIDKTLKSLRNRNNTYQENLDLINKVGEAEKQRLKNSTDLIDLELQIKEKQFYRDAGMTKASQELFNKFINGQITAVKLLDQVKGQVTEDEVKEISEVLLRREDATRESMVLEERLENLKAQNTDKEKSRIASLNAAKKKDHDDELKRQKELHDIYLKEKQAFENLIEFRLSREAKLQDETAKNADNETKIRIDAINNRFLKEQELIETQHEYALGKEELLANEKLLIEAKFQADSEELILKAEKEKADIRIKDAEEAKKIEDKKTEDAKKAEEERKAIRQQAYQQSYQLAVTIGNGLFDLQKQNLNQDLTILQEKHAKELALVGDNKQAQAIINAKFAKEEAKIKTAQAQADKDQAVFNIVLSTAQNVVKSFPNIALMALAAAMGGAQLAFVASKPIPKFNKGTKSVPGVDTGDDSVLAMLRPGEGVMPVDRMNDYRPAFNAIFDRKIPADFLNSMVLDYDRMGRALPVSSGNDLSGLQSELKGLRKDISKLQILQVTMDQKGFKTYLASGQSKSQLENNYLRTE